MRPHSFSKTFAEQHGISQAIVLKFLAYKTRRSTNIRDEKHWYYAPLDELIDKFPYLGRSTINEAVKGLEKKGMLQIGNYNQLPFDRTRWFHVPEGYWGAVEEHLIRFHTGDAQAYRITAAVLMFNLEYWLKRKVRAGKEGHVMSPKKLAERLPYKMSTIKGTLAKLVQAGALIEVPGKSSEYAFPPDRMRALRVKAHLS